MDLRNQVKHLLRMCGHAFVGTIHDRLNTTESMLQQVLEQNTHIAGTQTALLQSGVHLVENMAQVRTELAEAEGRVSAQVHEYWRPQEELLARTLERLAQGLGDLSALLDKQRADSILLLDQVTGIGKIGTDARSLLEEQLVRRICVETDDFAAMNPEAALLEFLYSYIPSRKALDIGAHVGDVSACLLRAGYEVYAFEPAPEVYDKLISRLGGQRNFHSFRLALGSEEGEALLHLATDLSPERYYEDPTLLSSLVNHSMPDNISYTRTVPVAIKTLAEFHRNGTIPDDIGLVKIDTEGFDLEVVRGMGAHRYPVVLTEYFDVRHPFGQSGLLYTLESLIHEMRDRGYLWHIVIHQDWHCKITGYYSNHEHAVPGTWGNVCFFSDRSIFSQAESWCSAILPRTYFKPIRTANGVK